MFCAHEHECRLSGSNSQAATDRCWPAGAKCASVTRHSVVAREVLCARTEFDPEAVIGDHPLSISSFSFLSVAEVLLQVENFVYERLGCPVNYWIGRAVRDRPDLGISRRRLKLMHLRGERPLRLGGHYISE